MRVVPPPGGLKPQRLAPWLVGAIAAGAWLALWAWGRSPHARFLDHDTAVHENVGVMLPVFVLAWLVMTTAMMLPTTLPLVSLFALMVSQRADRARLMTLLVVGYLAVWSAFGMIAHAGDRLLHVLADDSAWLAARPWVIPAGILAGAGVYQFSGLKYVCLDRCRSPRSFVVRHWRGSNAARQALALGAHHGLYCLGCCWALMLVMFAVGIGSLGWMLGLSAVMAMEKNLPWGRRLSTPLGVALIASGLLVVALG